MDIESWMKIYGPLVLFAVLFIVLLRWVLSTHERTVEAHMAGAEAARASAEVIKKNTEAVNDLCTDIKLLRQTINTREKTWSKRSSS